MTCVAVDYLWGSTYGWHITEGLTTIAFGAPRTIKNANKLAAVSKALEEDAGLLPVATDPYFFGKEVLQGFHT